MSIRYSQDCFCCFLCFFIENINKYKFDKISNVPNLASAIQVTQIQLKMSNEWVESTLIEQHALTSAHSIQITIAKHIMCRTSYWIQCRFLRNERNIIFKTQTRPKWIDVKSHDKYSRNKKINNKHEVNQYNTVFDFSFIISIYGFILLI